MIALGKIVIGRNTGTVDLSATYQMAGSPSGYAQRYTGNYWASNSYVYLPVTRGGFAVSSSTQYRIYGVGDAGGYFYTSNDYGNNWTARGVSSYYGTCVISASGQYQAILCYPKTIYVSSDYGASFTAKTVGTEDNVDLDISADGKYMIMAANYNKYCYLSSDFGNSWQSLPTQGSYSAVAISSNGQYQGRLIRSTGIFVSSNFGVNWAQKTSGYGFFGGISMCESGQYQTAVASEIWTSNDFGASWTRHTTFTYINGERIKVSASGQYQTVVTFQKGIYASSDFGASWAKVANDSTDYSYITMNKFNPV